MSSFTIRAREMGRELLSSTAVRLMSQSMGKLFWPQVWSLAAGQRVSVVLAESEPRRAIRLTLDET